MSYSDTHEERHPWWAWGCSAQLAPSDLTRYRRAHYWFGAWLVSMAAAVFGLDHWGSSLGPLVYPVAALPAVLMAIGLISYGKFLAHADELTRKIQVEAMAVGFGVGLLLAVTYPLAEKVGAPDLNLAYLVVVMVLAYGLTVTWLQRHYRP
jgi:hypothetical protein